MSSVNEQKSVRKKTKKKCVQSSKNCLLPKVLPSDFNKSKTYEYTLVSRQNVSEKSPLEYRLSTIPISGGQRYNYYILCTLYYILCTLYSTY